MSASIVIDAGHGGHDNGASFQGRLEKNDNLRMALALGERLSQDGFQVFYTRTTDVYQSPLQKAQIANATGADYFVSLHRNSNEVPNAYNGIMTLVYRQNPTVNALANNVNAQLEALGFKNLGIDERPGLVVLRRTQMPAILIEAGFINSDHDNQIFDDKFDQMINAMAVGIEKGLGQLGVDPPPTRHGDRAQPQLFGVQTGLFRHYGNARYMQDELASLGHIVRIRREEPYFAVVVGEEPSLEMAASLQTHLRSRGFDTLVVRL